MDMTSVTSEKSSSQPEGEQLLLWSKVETRVRPLSRDLCLELAVRLSAPIAGHIVEFGVFEGHSTRAIRRALDDIGGQAATNKRVLAFDSFKGLPEGFEQLDAGAFACMPPNIPGVSIVPGYFEDTLTPALADELGAISFAHLDADLYSSTLCALRWMTPMLRTGSLLLFDEFVGGNFAERRAFDEWRTETRIECVRVGSFLRTPSGGGHYSDERVLFQVVGKETLPENIRNAGDPIDSTRMLAAVGRRVMRRLFA